MTRVLKICHLTSAHPWEDVRIFHKECTSLAKNSNYEVSLISGKGESVTKNGVKVYSVAAPKDQGRFSRMRETVTKVLEEALKVDADVYHLHDPELLRIALKLKKRGKKVIYDAHEDLPRQILGKYWIPKILRKTMSYLFEQYENYVSKRLDAVVAATPFIKERFIQVNANTVDVNNYPILSEKEQVDEKVSGSYLCYAGGITANRGIASLVKATECLQGVTLKLAGRYSPENFRNELQELKGWKNVQEMGYLPREKVRSLIKGSIAGVVTLKPLPNYLDSLPIKMFEYMHEGVPVIASNFPLWKSIIEDNNCGICVDPESPEEIARALKKIMASPELAKSMGERGKVLVETKYNWEIEEGKLLNLYQTLLS